MAENKIADNPAEEGTTYNEAGIAMLAKLVGDVLNTRVAISWFRGMEDQMMMDGNESDGAILKFTHAGHEYGLKIFFTFTEIEYDKTLHQAILYRDGERIFDIGATYDGIGNSVLNKVQ